jgi:hypothetical protein
MGSSLSLQSKDLDLQSGPEDLNSFSSKSEVFSLLNQILTDPQISDLESSAGTFAYIHNYYLIGSSSRFSKVHLNYEDSEVTKLHSITSPLIGKDQQGTWVYIGEVLTGSKIKDGRGLWIHLQKKCKFQGYFKGNSRNGRGRLVTNEKILEGDWIEDEIAGEAKEITKEKTIYVGKFLGGLYEGLGKIVFPDKSTYSGEFVKGEKAGYGEYFWNDGSKFTGHWICGKFHGIGKYLDAHGNCFEGGWKENLMDGYGEFLWKDGNKYKGNYYNGKKHGYGEMYWVDGRTWRGSWKNGKMHGKGTLFKQGVKEIGIWYDGKFLEVCREN